ncbi:MAG TPA: hypothetical protein ENN29_00365 [Candidatus Hydrogenedentes bacterium]|nr:hypothetical protein [Candidatus Hydrogenedentota bacterium]
MIVTAKIGAIEFAGNEVRVTVIKTGGKLPRVLEVQARTAVYEAEDDRFTAMVHALDEALDALRVHPATYVLCVPSAFTIVRSLTIPFKGVNRVAKAVPFEIEPHLAFPLEELLLDHITIAEIDGNTEVLAVGARRKHLEEQLAILEAAGVEPELAAVDAAGLTALWQATQKNSRGLRAVLHVREKGAVLAVMFNNALAYFRHLQSGVDQITQNPVAVAQEVQNTLRAFMAKWHGGGDISTLSITGLEMRADEMQVFEEITGCAVDTINVIRLLKGAEAALTRANETGGCNRWEAAIGVGYSAAGGGMAFNLMRENQQINGVARSVVAHLMFSACLALLFLLGCAWYYHEGRLRNEAVIEQTRNEIAMIEEEIELMAAEGLGNDVEFAVFSDPPLLDVLQEIAQRMPEDKVTITEIRVAQPGARSAWIDIAGSTSSAADFEAAFEELKKSDMFALADETNIRLQGERTTFRVRAFRTQEELSDAQS